MYSLRLHLSALFPTSRQNMHFKFRDAGNTDYRSEFEVNVTRRSLTLCFMVLISRVCFPLAVRICRGSSSTLCLLSLSLFINRKSDYSAWGSNNQPFRPLLRTWVTKTNTSPMFQVRGITVRDLFDDGPNQTGGFGLTPGGVHCALKTCACKSQVFLYVRTHFSSHQGQ